MVMAWTIVPSGGAGGAASPLPRALAQASQGHIKWKERDEDEWARVA